VNSDQRRYQDSPPQDEQSVREFIVRTRKPSLQVIAAAFLIAFISVNASVWWMELIGGSAAVMMVSFVVLGILAWFTITVTQNNRDLVMMTEHQNALFSSVANLNNLFMLIVKGNGTITYYSSDYQKVFADARRFGLTSLDSLLESDGITPESTAKLRAAMEAGQPEVIFGELRDIEGNIQKVRIALRPIPRPVGYFVLSVSSLRRRTSDKNEPAQQADGDGYHAAHALPKAVQDALFAAPLGFCAFDKTGSPLFIHPEIEQWLGFGNNEIIDKRIRIQDIVNINPTTRDAKLELDSFEGEVLFKRANNTVAKAFVVQKIFLDADGQPGGCCTVIAPTDKPNPFRHASGTLSDEITESTSAAYLNDLLDNAPMGIALLDKHGQILRYNSFFASLTDIAQYESHGLSIVDIVDSEHKGEVVERINEILRTNQSAPEKPVSITLKGESPKTASLYLAHLPRSGDSSAEMVVHLINTTEQRSLEEKFAHSQKMQAVGQLAGGIAHDFNNLLTAMIGFCDLLLMRHPAGDQSFADIMQIKQNGNRAANLVRQLLAFSRRQTLQPKLIDITDVLAELSNLIRRLIGENIDLNMVHGKDLGMVKVDLGQFEQVIINLAVNARDAMSGSGGSLSIRSSCIQISRTSPVPKNWVSPTDEDPVSNGDYVLIEVIDTGTGIPKDIIRKIFEPFFSTKEVGAGTGLGLATVYGIIKQTGGHIFVASEENKGTTFALLFKRYEPEVEKKTITADSDAGSSMANADLTGKSTILLVEDEAPVRMFASRALRNKGYTVLEADCGEAAIELMQQEGGKVELIISDVIMPGIDGPSMVKEVWKQFPHLQVIFISGYAEDALGKMEDSENEFFFLPKPFTLKQLAEKVKEVTSK
jgi:two-component system cell cycle sensor histidine kinase/response regulator CckA